jgi:hypothetical protein
MEGYVHDLSYSHEPKSGSSSSSSSSSHQQLPEPDHLIEYQANTFPDLTTIAAPPMNHSLAGITTYDASQIGPIQPHLISSNYSTSSMVGSFDNYSKYHDPSESFGLPYDNYSNGVHPTAAWGYWSNEEV